MPEKSKHFEIEQGITTPDGVIFRNRLYPSSEGAVAILSVPFRNEELMLPNLAQRLAKQPLSRSVYFIGVNHLSTDSSVSLFEANRSSFYKLEVLPENSLQKSVSPPRKAGLDLSYALAKQSEKNTPLISIDADTEPSEDFIQEIINNSKTHDVVIFPVRNIQKELTDFIDKQEEDNKPIAIKSLLGADWFRFQLKQAMLRVGCIEPGSAGFSINSNVYERVGGFIPATNKDGKFVLGSNAELGKRIQSSGVNVFVSSKICYISPRRLIGSFTTKSSRVDGYNQSLDYSEASNETSSVPKEIWKTYLEEQIDRGLEVMLTRVPYQGKTMNLLGLFSEIPCWKSLLNGVESFYRINGYINGEQYRLCVKELGNQYIQFRNFLIEKWIPDNDSLLDWSSKNSELEDVRIKSLI